MPVQLGQWGAQHLLMSLGQLPAQCRRTLTAEDLGHGDQGVVDTTRGLQEDHGALLGGQGLQRAPPFPRFTG